MAAYVPGWLLQLALDGAAAVFLLAGVGKLTSPRAFRLGLLTLPYFRVSWAWPVAVLLPLVEVATALGLFFNHGEAKAAALALLGLFCVAAWMSLSRRLQVKCNCFGAFGGERMLSWRTIAENGALAAGVAASFALPARVDVLIGPLVAMALLSVYAVGMASVSNLGRVRELQKAGFL